jgi:hypothetical protein
MTTTNPKPKRAPKTRLAYVVQGNYGHGWEDEAAADNWKEALEDYRAYLENGPGGYRVITRREPNPDFVGPVA